MIQAHGQVDTEKLDTMKAKVLYKLTPGALYLKVSEFDVADKELLSDLQAFVQNSKWMKFTLPAEVRKQLRNRNTSVDILEVISKNPFFKMVDIKKQ